MSDAFPPGFEQPPEQLPKPLPEPAIFTLPVAPERDPFWGYNDLLLFISLVPVCAAVAFFLVRAIIHLLHAHPPEVEEALPIQFVFYLFLFGALGVVFRMWYEKPFWNSLGWRRMRIPFLWVIIAGMSTAFLIAFLSTLIRVPDTENEMTQLMQGAVGLALMTVFGVTVAPVCEELAFRGFLQPLLVRSLGAAPGVLLAAIPFGLLHYQEYGNSWRHALVISGAGVAFGVMRQATGSTKASALMHASYNGLLFATLLADRKEFPHLW